MRFKIWFVRHKSATWSTDSIQQISKIISEQNLNSELHWYSQKEIQSLLYQFSFVVHLRLGILMLVLARYLKKRTFGCLNEEEESLFMTLRTLDWFCRSCSSSVTLNSSILLTVLTAYGLNQLGLDNNVWPIFETQMLQIKSVHCLHCNRAMLLK